jgi:hypothetical protein
MKFIPWLIIKSLKKYLLFARHISYKRGVNGYYPGGTEDGAE